MKIRSSSTRTRTFNASSKAKYALLALATLCLARSALPDAQFKFLPKNAKCTVTSFDRPALEKPVDPMKFGAKCDGTTDDTAAFQRAMDAGDVLVPARTCVIAHTVTIKASNRRMECRPGAMLKRNVSGEHTMFLYEAGRGLLMNNSIVGCTFEGANSEKPVVDWDAPGHWDIPVQTTDNVSNFLLAGNTFRQFFGQSMFQTLGGNGGSGDRIVFNTFENCPLYGPVFVGHQNGYVGYNKAISCTVGVENDHDTDNTGGNVFECNQITTNQSEAKLTGGVYGVGANYSGNTVRYNTITGEHSWLLIKHQEKGRDAKYLDNQCGGGCRVQ
ncbi:hypothetical protein [Caballeronia insecticola]|uniref:Parallel beta-helix repeat n=1 Tax=Caballeronia insecticola TaxID=758793 RepID=R4X2T9_9BURK|nr:hypothetical protein [Caballeronia insecticola]BAN26926.1 parallel beta-helix repeat [Caballeronia insecticola]